MSDEKDLERKVLDAISSAIEGTEWAPPEGGILVDALVVMIHLEPNGHMGTSWINQGSEEQAYGAAAYVMRSIDTRDRLRHEGRLICTCDLDEEDE